VRVGGRMNGRGGVGVEPVVGEHSGGAVSVLLGPSSLRVCLSEET